MSLNVMMVKKAEQKNNQYEELFSNENLLNYIYNFSNDYIVVLSEDKQVIECSSLFKKLFFNEEVIGKNFVDLMNRIAHMPDDFFKEKSYFLTVNEEDSFRAFQADIVKYISDRKELNRYVVILKDVNEQLQMQAQKDNFIATLTHDLKTPVRADILSLELLLKGRFGQLTPEQAEIIQEILNSNKFMMSMLDTLLAKYKYESEEVGLHKTDFNLNEFVEKCIKELKCIFEEKNISYTLNFSDNPIIINADKIELKRALTNLITNAIKFNNDYGAVNISVHWEEEAIKIKVADTGIGMNKEKIEHIFDRYVSYAKRFRKLGTGLGLYVAKKIVEAHNGKIEVDSIEGQGSTFTIILPTV